MRVVCLLALTLFLTATWWSVQSALGDYYFSLNTLGALRRAVSLAPGNASYHALLAEHMEGAGLDPDAEFLRAALLSPLDSASWIRLGFRAEVEGDYPKAEEYLIHASTVDRKFNPRWTLMNYYYRRESSGKFWYWASRSMEMSHGDISPIFKLMWDMTQDGALIAQHIPPKRDAILSYLQFLTSNHPESARPVALKAARLAGMSDLYLLEDYCDRILDSDITTAVDVWNIACERKLFPFSELIPQQGRIITNGDFATAPTQRVFDWRTPLSEGVTVVPEDPRTVAIRISDEPEDCLLLTQTLPLTPGTRYRIDYEYRWTSDHPLRGMGWEVSVPAGAGPVTHSPEFAPGDGWTAGSFTFASPGSSARLALHYKRPMGVPLAEGVVAIRRVTGSIAPGSIAR